MRRPGHPRTRGDCVDGPRPCPWVSCRYHLWVRDIKRDRLKEASCAPWELSATCALDVADRVGMTLEEVGVVLGVTRERVRQIEVGALAKVRKKLRRVFPNLRAAAPVLSRAERIMAFVRRAGLVSLEDVYQATGRDSVRHTTRARVHALTRDGFLVAPRRGWYKVP